MPARRAAVRARHANRQPPERTRLLRGIANGLLIEAIAIGVILGLAWVGARI